MMMRTTALLVSSFACTASFAPLSMQRRRRPAFALVGIHHFHAAGGDIFVLKMAGEQKIGVFFGTSTGSTEEVADLIVEAFGSNVAAGPIEIDGVQGHVADEFAKYDALVVGTPTWNTGADTERSGTGWDEIYYGEMEGLDNIKGKKVAVFGLGDSVSYAENYADASGELHDVFQNLGGDMIGYTSQDGYLHEDSKAIRGDLFCGLLCDQVNQEDLTEGRVTKWVAQLQSEGILEGGGAAAVATAPAAAAPPVVVEAVPEPAVPEPVAAESAAQEALLKELERENAQLRKLLEDNSKMLDETISVHGGRSSGGDGFVPHCNSRTGRTMWISPNGRSCYYTMDPPTSKLTP